MRDTPAFDDETLWFPAHMSAGDSFSRPLAADGSGTATLDDGIGLPRARTRAGAPRRRKTATGGIKASSWVWLTVWGAAALGIATYAARKDIVIEWAQGWLRGQGVQAHLRLDTLSLGHASGSFILGNPKRPDASAGRFDADFSLNLFAGGGRPLVRLQTARLDQVALHLSYKDGKLGFGTLDRLVHTLTVTQNTPPRTVTIDDTDVRVDSDYGALHGRGSAVFRDGRLSYLSLKLPAARLDGVKGGGDFGGAEVLARATGDHTLQVQAQASASQFDLRDGNRVVEGAPAHPVQTQGVTLDISGRVPDADTGPLDAAINVTAQGLRAQGLVVADADYRVKLNGTLRGRAHYDGTADIAAHVGRVDTRGLQARRVAVTANGLKVVTRAGTISVAGAADAGAGEVRRSGIILSRTRLHAARFTFNADAAGRHGDFSGTMTAGGVAAGDLDLTGTTAQVTGTFDGDTASGAWRAGVAGGLDTGGSYAGLHALARGRTYNDDLARLDRGLGQFTLKAPGFALSLDGQGAGLADIDLRLKAPAEAALAGGLTLDLVPQDGAPIVSSHAPGAFSLDLKGAPTAGLDLSNLTLSSRGALSGDYALDASFSLAPFTGARVLAKGRVSAVGGLVATLTQPLTFTAQSADLGETFTRVSGTLGTAGDPVLKADASGWRIGGAFTRLALQAPNEHLALSGGRGAVDITDQGLKANLDAAQLSDAAPGAPRFYPLSLSGALTGNDRVLNGRFTAAARSRPVLAISLENDAALGRGQLGVHTLNLTFSPDGLQPRDLSPLGVLIRQVSGGLDLDGAFRWDHGRRASSGRLSVDGLSFTGVPGRAEGVSGRIDFTSLAPLTSAPDQGLSIHRLDIGLPLSDVTTRLQVAGDHIALGETTAQTPGGPLRLEAVTVPFAATTPVVGAIAFDGLDFGKIVAASDLAASLTFEGRLSGRVPFSILGGQVGFGDGWLKADGPGTLSIRRQALSAVVASGTLTADGQAQPATVPAGANPFRDLAGQAMAHLHYDRLDAQIHSTPDGGADALWHVEGRFDPPARQRPQIRLQDYLDGAWAAKPLALPSDTPVDLYLDMPLETLGAR